MFTGFGLMALSKAYDHYLDQHIPVIKELITRIEIDKKEQKQFKYSNEFVELLQQKLDQVRSIALKENNDGNLQQRGILITSTTSSKE